MKYFKAFPIENKPFITWHLWANSLDELRKLKADNDPLIMLESDIPSIEGGIYPFKISNGRFVQHSLSEKETYDKEYCVFQLKNRKQFIRNQIKEIQSEIEVSKIVAESTVDLNRQLQDLIRQYNQSICDKQLNEFKLPLNF